MDSESQVIHDQMEETRTSLQDKLETLEQQVTTSVHNATEAVTDTVDSVKEAFHDTVASVKDSLDVSHAGRAPSVGLFLGAVPVGFVGWRVLDRMLRPAHLRPLPSGPHFQARRIAQRPFDGRERSRPARPRGLCGR